MNRPSVTIGCVKTATKILGDKWTPILIRCIANDTSVRFCELQDRADGINPRTLSARLTALENDQIIEKTPASGPHRAEYRLTKKGRDLTPILKAMDAWGERYC